MDNLSKEMENKTLINKPRPDYKAYDKMTDEEKEEYEFKLENARIEHKALTDEYDLFIMQKDREIATLNDALKKTSPRYKWLYFAGGILVGTAASYGAYKVFDG